MAPARKRTRKRKRRAASFSTSSSSSSSSGDEAPVVQPPPSIAVTTLADEESSTSSDETESDSTRSSSSSDAPPDIEHPEVTPSTSQRALGKGSMRNSVSPSPPPAEIPSFLPDPSNVEERQQREDEMKKRFKQFWMSSIAEGFKDDLEEIRKEPNMTTSRLALLIDSLASGAEVFTTTSVDSQEVNEVELVLQGQ